MNAVAVSSSWRSVGVFDMNSPDFGIRIAGHADVGQHDVVGERQVVVAHRLAFLRDAGEAARAPRWGR